MASYRLALLTAPPPLESAGVPDADTRPNGGIYDHLGGGIARSTAQCRTPSRTLRVRPVLNDWLRQEAIGQAAGGLTARMFQRVTVLSLRGE